ncbi:MAG: magnesium chelatase ATPase subunit I [Alphaproteobacteria bacterium]|nr:magnesium chelatase ATPase subunit I [Alphaproteobacteria bacterium]
MAAYFPFPAIVGQSEMKRALIIAAVDPNIGGVMIFGDRGSGKSTAVRGLAALLPPIAVVDGCPYRRDPESKEACVADCPVCGGKEVRAVLRGAPVIDLPLGATEDRVVGALDLETALTRGEKRFQPGLLAAAHRGFLYIDEVNLLEDHLVDLLLDVAASGENVVEREGLSVRHPAQFVLVGSGNPEEGELRPQLLDRFGLSVEVTTPTDIAERVEAVRRRDAFDRDPAAFHKKWRAEESALRQRIADARARRDAVRTPDAMLEKSAQLCIKLGADGLRGELTMLRAARALAAYERNDAVGEAHIKSVAAMALRHRLRRNPLDEVGSSARIARALEEDFA